MRSSLISLPRRSIKKREPLYYKKGPLYLLDPLRPIVNTINDDEFEGPFLNRAKWGITINGTPTWTYNTPLSPSCLRTYHTAASQAFSFQQSYVSPAAIPFSVSLGGYASFHTSAAAVTLLVGDAGLTNYEYCQVSYVSGTQQWRIHKRVSSTDTFDIYNRYFPRGKFVLRIERSSGNIWRHAISPDGGYSWEVLDISPAHSFDVAFVQISVDSSSQSSIATVAFDFVRFNWLGTAIINA